MDRHLLSILDYFKIKKMIEKEIFTIPGKKYLEELFPGTDFSLVSQWQKETTQMRNILEEVGRPPFTVLRDIKPDLRQSRIQGIVLSPSVFLNIAKVLTSLYEVKTFFNQANTENYPLIEQKNSQLKIFRLLEKEIQRCISEEGEINDKASPDLSKIRQKIRTMQQKLRDRLDHIIKDPRNRLLIQDDVITLRQGRYVIPVKWQEKGKFPGIVHDKSESGMTVFIEPLSIVKSNNQLRECYQEEEKEKFKILRKLTDLVSQNGEDILNSYHQLGHLDFIHAKAQISLSMKATEPKLNIRGFIRLLSARNPLLKEKAVPIDIELGNIFDVLVITGPNTGGKTVTLKTVGLLNLMAQSGLHIPADLDSEIAVFDKIFADIGDEQSIEQNLSTFSSHMQQIIQILNLADKNTLVLLDELGAGTDPSEGSALSMAILDSLKDKGVKILSTTHHDSIKAYAYLTEKVANARVEFDEATLRPTYKISIGLPGKSCAFSISERLGLSKKIIFHAKQYLEKEKLDLENLIKKMERDRDLMTKNLAFSEEERKKIVQLKEELEKRISTLESERQKVKLDTYQQAEEILSNTQKRAKQIIHSLKRKKPEKEVLTENYTILEKYKKEIKEKIEKYKSPQEKVDIFSEGDYVLIKDLSKEGIVIEKNEKKKQCQIQVDHLKLTVPFSNIQKISSSQPSKKINTEEKYDKPYGLSYQDRLEKKARFKNEINIRQMKVADAQVRVEKYLDDAFLLNISPVYVIHGKGKGILREKVVQMLDELDYVKSYRYGELREGGDGVTVVYF